MVTVPPLQSISIMLLVVSIILGFLLVLTREVIRIIVYFSLLFVTVINMLLAVTLQVEITFLSQAIFFLFLMSPIIKVLIKSDETAEEMTSDPEPICKFCGNNLDSTQKVCSSCGAPTLTP